jgi:hypothetical protein
MWSVKTAEGTATYDKAQLSAILIKDLMTRPIGHDQKELADQVVQLLADGGAVVHTTMAEVLELGFRVGYLYRIFLEKNNVVLPETPSTITENLVDPIQ